MIQYLTRHYDNLLRALAEHLQILAVTLVFSLLIAAVLTILAVYFRGSIDPDFFGDLFDSESGVVCASDSTDRAGNDDDGDRSDCLQPISSAR